MSTAPARRLTPQEYLAIERRAPTKSEYYRGEMFAMSGASKKHNLVAGNVFGLIWQQLRGRLAKAYSPGMRVKVEALGYYAYPDVTVVGGQPRFDDDHCDTLLNPLAIIEVFSRSSENYDQGAKFAHYRQFTSLQEYLLVADSRVFAMHWMRQADNSWRLTDHHDATQTLHLASIDCRLPLADIYDKVEFPATGSEPDDKQ